MGILGILMLALIASGLWAWWPRPGGWRRGLHFKRRAAPVRRLYDWHKLTGVGALVLLLVVTGTGVLLDLPDQVRPLLRQLSPLFTPPALTVTPAGTPLPVDALVRRAEQRFPDAALAWIETPAGPTPPIRINLARPGEPSRRFPRTNVWRDPYSGRILAVRDGLAEHKVARGANIPSIAVESVACPSTRSWIRASNRPRLTSPTYNRHRCFQATAVQGMSSATLLAG